MGLDVHVYCRCLDGGADDLLSNELRRRTAWERFDEESGPPPCRHNYGCVASGCPTSFGFALLREMAKLQVNGPDQPSSFITLQGIDMRARASPVILDTGDAARLLDEIQRADQVLSRLRVPTISVWSSDWTWPYWPMSASVWCAYHGNRDEWPGWSVCVDAEAIILVDHAMESIKDLETGRCWRVKSCVYDGSRGVLVDAESSSPTPCPIDFWDGRVATVEMRPAREHVSIALDEVTRLLRLAVHENGRVSFDW